MQLFVDTEFFIWLIFLSIPAFILGLMEKPIHIYGFFVSVFFIIMSMGGTTKALLYMILYIMFEHVLAVIYTGVRERYGRKAGVYYLFLLLSISPLVTYKVTSVTGNGILGFLGISYMTFKSAQVIIEIYDGQIKEISPFSYIYMMIFFPVVTSGPIDRSRRFDSDINNPLPRSQYLELAGKGLFKILLGVLYKVIIAKIFYQLMTWYGMDISLKSGIIYMYTYGLYLFFDFAGYSLMAVGSSYIFGIKTPDNFNKPFLSCDIKEFWDRWHITLSHWFRDYIFSRVTMGLMKTKKIRSRLSIACIAFFVNMGIMGLWHGLTSYYIAYGLYHATLLSITEVYQKKSKFHKAHKKDNWYRIISWFTTMNLVFFGFFIFSGRIMKFLP